jgi:hypothetical protein
VTGNAFVAKGFRGGRERGALLLEVVVAMSLLLVGILGLMTTFASNYSATKGVMEKDEARAALENITEILRGSNFATLYANYDGATLEVPYLQGTTSGPATVAVRCHVNERALPAEFGPILDIDGAGGLDNTDCRAHYELLPVQLTLNYATKYGAETRNLYLIFRSPPST